MSQKKLQTLKQPKQITMVTVTYGSRCALLAKVVDQAIVQGIHKIIVIDNGSKWDVTAWINIQYYSQNIDVVKLPNNSGSAEGFATGIDRAVKSGAEFIWLMDDDNVPDDGCVENLIYYYQRMSEDVSLDKLAICALRQSTKTRINTNKAITRPDTFLSFHLRDLPGKVATRIWTRPIGSSSQQDSADIVVMDMAPYGGVLFHSSVIHLIGLPKRDFVLYGDDGEFTFRLTKHGGVVGCCTKASLTDIDDSWNANKMHQSSFSVWLKGKDELRTYYYARNQAWIDSHLTRKRNTIYQANKYFYISMLVFFAIIWRRGKRLHVLLRAINDGEHDILGVTSGYELK